MKIIILFALFASVCSSKSKQNLEDFLHKKCVEYEKKYEKVDKTNLQGEDTYYVVPEPGTSSAVNGDDAFPGSFQHMAALGYTTGNGIDWVCGGSLISEQYILTAAHCLKRRHNMMIEEVEWVRLGVVELSKKYGPYPKDYKVIQRIAHPSYEPPSKYNDIGLLKLETATEITKYIKPICLTTKTEKELAEYVSYSAIGWGVTQPNGNKSDILQVVYLDLYSKEDCNKAYNVLSSKLLKDGINQEQQICLGSFKINPSDTCQGDSGGPLHFENQDGSIEVVRYQLGITSFGNSCALKKSPGIYTRVSYYLPWIKSIVWPNEK